MKERPILFSAPMVRAILAGTKTQTRRVVKRIPWLAGANPEFTGARPFVNAGEWRIAGSEEMTTGFRCPYGQPGDRLWVKESFWGCDLPGYGDTPCVVYDDEWIGKEYAPAQERPWARKFGRIPSIHMPRDTSRITLEITDVRVERLQALTIADAVAEGMHPNEWLRGDDDLMVGEVMHAIATPGTFMEPNAPIARFVLLWDSINGKQPGVTNWNANPWVWVVSFKRVTP